MQVSQAILRAMAQEVIKRGSAKGAVVEQKVRGRTLWVITLSDITVSLQQKNGKKVLFGIVFEALGYDFVVTPEGNLLVTGSEEGGEEETFEVNDPALFGVLEKFLEWRTKALQEVGI